MATDKVVPGDLGSREVEEIRLQLNRLTVFIEAIKAAATTDGDTFQAAVAALTEDADLETILLVRTPPTAPKVSLT